LTARAARLAHKFNIRSHIAIERLSEELSYARIGVMGFKAFHSAAATIAGIETAHMIRKGQIPANGGTAFQTFAELAA
jgi:transposase-like protein